MFFGVLYLHRLKVAGFLLSCREVFVAPELDAIEQCPPGEDPKISLGNSGVFDL